MVCAEVVGWTYRFFFGGLFVAGGSSILLLPLDGKEEIRDEKRGLTMWNIQYC